MNDKDLCPESQGMRCATTPDCTRDSARGCRVCQCGNPYPTAPVHPGPRAQRSGPGARPHAAAALKGGPDAGRQRAVRFPSRSAACAAASRATGTRNGEQDT